MEYWRNELYHHGILGMKWGKKNGPPYPLAPNKHSASERKAGWRKSLNKSSNKQDLENAPEGGAGGGMPEEDDKILEQLYDDLEDVIAKTGMSGYELILSDNFSVFLWEAGINVDKLSKEQISRLRQKAIQHYRGNTTKTYKNRPRARQHNVTGPMKEGAFTKRGKVEVVPDWLKEKNEESWVAHSSLYHHGILGMKWGKRNGPPYPLSRDSSGHTAEERKVGWRKSLGGGRNTELYDRNEAKNARKRYWKKKGYSSPPPKAQTINTTENDSVSTDEKRGLTDTQKKALIIGGTALMVGGAAIAGYKLHQLNLNAVAYKQAVNSVKNLISTEQDIMVSRLRNTSNELFGREWTNARSSLQDISERIDSLPNVEKNPFVSSQLKDTSTMRKDVVNLYKDLSSASDTRNNSILNEFKKETVEKAKPFYETFQFETFEPETFQFEAFKPETLNVGEDYAKQLLNSNMETLRNMGF